MLKYAPNCFWPPPQKHSISRFDPSLRTTLVILLTAFLCFGPLGFAVSARDKNGIPQSFANVGSVLHLGHTHEEEESPKTGDVDSFIIEMIDGIATCRYATLTEVPSTLPRPGEEGIPVKDVVKPTAGESLRSSEDASDGLTINFLELSQLQSDPDRTTVIAAFQRAAAVWTAKIKSPITITMNIDYGLNRANGQPFGDTTLGSTSSGRIADHYSSLRSSLISTAADGSELSIYNSLPASAIPTDTGDGSQISISRSLTQVLGLLPPEPNTVVATISFNKKFSFDFNPDDGINPSATDFVAVAAHEIGHALGFTSNAGQGSTAAVALLDMFRLRPGATAATFPTAQRIMSIGGEQVYFTGQTFTLGGMGVSELGLSTGGPDPQEGDGDGRQSSHWKADEFTGQYIGIMDPTISRGELKVATDNDFKAFETIGWNLIESTTPPPPRPPAANDNFANAQVIAGCSGSVNGTNLNSTKEAGEPSHIAGAGSRSVWYQWQAPSNSEVTIDTIGSGYDTVLAVYTGTSVNALAGTLVANNDDIVGSLSSRVTFTANAGTLYRIAVDGFNNGGSGGDMGPIKLNWTQSNCTVTSWDPVVLSANQVEIKTWTVQDRTSAYVKLTFPDAGYRVANWGSVVPAGSDFSVNALVERFNGVSAQAIKTTAQIYDLGVLSPGNYTFTFKTSGTTVETQPFTVNPPPPPANPIDDQREFVRRQYLDFLNREPDGPGWDFWTGNITKCSDPAQRAPGQTEAQCITRQRETTSAAFFVSPEFQNTGYFVLRVYRGSLGRMPFFGGTGDNTKDEFTRDHATVSTGIVVSNQLDPDRINSNKQAFVNAFVTRADFQAIYSGLNNQQYVDKLIETTGLPSTAELLQERDQLITGLTNGTETRATVLFKIVDGTNTIANGALQFNSKHGQAFYNLMYNPAFVQMEYFGYMRRDPDDAGFTFWLNKMNQFGNGNFVAAEMVLAFILSPEYRSRFGAP